MPSWYLGRGVIPVVNYEKLLEWSNFVYKVDQLIADDLSNIPKWKKGVFEALGLPILSKHTDRKKFNCLFEKMKNDLGSILMQHLFRNKDGRGVPNILWGTLSGVNKQQNIRHPINWLVIMFWQKDKLNFLGD